MISLSSPTLSLPLLTSLAYLSASNPMGENFTMHAISAHHQGKLIMPFFISPGWEFKCLFDQWTLCPDYCPVTVTVYLMASVQKLSRKSYIFIFPRKCLALLFPDEQCYLNCSFSNLQPFFHYCIEGRLLSSSHCQKRKSWGVLMA